MFKENVITEEVIEKTYFCDICKEKMSKFRKCSICKRDICMIHATYEYGEGDSYEVYCLNCWNIGKPFRRKIKEEDERSYKVQEDLAEEWRKAALKNVGDIK